MFATDRELLGLLRIKILLKKGNPPTAAFLQWIYERMESKHAEDPGMDYMLTLKAIVDELKEIEVLVVLRSFRPQTQQTPHAIRPYLLRRAHLSGVDPHVRGSS